MRDDKPESGINWKDLLENDDFRKWVKHPETDTETRWYAIAGRLAVEKARAFLLDQAALIDDISYDERNRKRAGRALLRRIKMRETRKYSAIAATLLLLIVCGSAGVFLNSGAKHVEEWVYYRGIPDSVVSIFLADGTAIDLGHGAVLRHGINIGSPGVKREVWLDGEAYFNVRTARSAAEVFKVHANELTVAVLGTSFNVNARSGSTQVVLEEGKVKIALPALDRAAEEILLAPGERLNYDTQNRTASKETVTTRYYTSWKDGELVFDDRPLTEVAERIGEVFGLEVELIPLELGSEVIRLTTSSSDLNEFVEILSTLTGGAIEARLTKDRLVLLDRR